MKKKIVSILSLLFIVGLISVTSCKKDQVGNGTQFNATAEGCTSQDGKIYLDGNEIKWVEGDLIAVYGNAGGGVYAAGPRTSSAYTMFHNISGVTGDGPFRAFYPSSLTNDGVNIILPATQTSVDGSLTEFPMYAEGSTDLLSFKNLCGILKLHLTKENISISSIRIVASNEINGTYSVNYNEGAPEIEYSANGTNATTLVCSTPQSIANGKDFYIYLPEDSYNSLRIEMYTNNGKYCVKTSNRAINVVRSKFTLVTLDAEYLDFIPCPIRVEYGNRAQSQRSVPFSNYYCHGVSQTIYLASEIGTAGYIDTIWYYCTHYVSSICDTLRIYMANTSLSQFAVNDNGESAFLPFSAFDLVFDTIDYTYATGEGWNPIVLHTPFYYNGVDNLMVFCFRSKCYTLDEWAATYGGGVNMSICRGCDSDYPSPFNIYPAIYPYNARPNARPDTRFSIHPDDSDD